MNHNLSGYWFAGAFVAQVGNQVTAEPDFSVISPIPWTKGVGTLSGDLLTMEFSGGGLSRPVTYTGTVSPDGLQIKWSNETVWTKKTG